MDLVTPPGISRANLVLDLEKCQIEGNSEGQDGRRVVRTTVLTIGNPVERTVSAVRMDT